MAKRYVLLIYLACLQVLFNIDINYDVVDKNKEDIILFIKETIKNHTKENQNILI